MSSMIFGVRVTPELMLKALLLAFSLGVIYTKLESLGELLGYKLDALEHRVTKVEAKLEAMQP